MNTRTKTGGFTLIETLVVLAIIAVMMALIFAALSPVREKARQRVCVSNMKQIAMAVQMYRQEWGGADPDSGAVTPAQLGLPLSPFLRMEGGAIPLLGPEEIWHCPDGPGRRDAWGIRNDYGYQVWDSELFSKFILERGDDYPLVWDNNHPWVEPGRVRLVIVLRLGGRVEVKQTTSSNSDEW